MARGRFKSLSVSETVYNKLKEIAERRGFSTLADTIAYLVSLEELIVRRLEHVTTNSGNVTSSTGNVTTNSGNITPNARGNIASNIAPNIGANIAPNTGASQPKPVASTSGGYEWCRSKDRVRDLRSFLKWVDERMGLIDWWEEEDKYCFKTREKPSKAG